jgi:hypothetical protein
MQESTAQQLPQASQSQDAETQARSQTLFLRVYWLTFNQLTQLVQLTKPTQVTPVTQVTQDTQPTKQPLSDDEKRSKYQAASSRYILRKLLTLKSDSDLLYVRRLGESTGETVGSVMLEKGFPWEHVANFLTEYEKNFDRTVRERGSYPGAAGSVGSALLIDWEVRSNFFWTLILGIPL